MQRQIVAALCAAAVLGFAASSSLAVAQHRNARAAHGAGASNADRQGAAVITTIQELMQSIIDPSADGLWNASGTVVDQDGVHDGSPKTAEEWLDVRRAAVRIIEGGNLLMMPGRDAAPAGTRSETPGVELEPAEITALIKKNRKTFNSFAKALQDLGVESLHAVDAKDVMGLLEIGSRMEGVCEGCHQTFWYPPPQKRAAFNDVQK
jgi:hypothetical protein